MVAFAKGADVRLVHPAKAESPIEVTDAPVTDLSDGQSAKADAGTDVRAPRFAFVRSFALLNAPAAMPFTV